MTQAVNIGRDGLGSPQLTAPQWYVTDWAQRRWFGDDEYTARTYLLLMKFAFDMKPGIDVFLGRDVPPPHIAATPIKE